MLRNRRIPQIKKLSQTVNGLRTLDKLAQDHQSMSIGDRLKKTLGINRLIVHLVRFYIHLFEYTTF